MRAPNSKGCRLQRFFSTFPGRWPGVGLLLVRCVVGFGAAMQGGSYLVSAAPAGVTMRATALLAIASGASLLIGLVTPGAASLAALTLVMIAGSRFPAGDIFLDWAGAVSVAAVAAALILLGPGALSLDARLFGRREIVFSSGRNHSSH